MKKVLAIIVIALFIGVAVAPTINFTAVKASTDNDLVEVTTQACGIQGYGNNTVQLTREQYQNLEQYFIEFRAKLNQTLTREEAVPIFKEAIVELNKYHLLPKGMSVKIAQRLVTGWNQNAYERLLNQRQQEDLPPSENVLCLLFISATKNQTYSPDVFFGALGPLALFTLIAFLIICPSQYSFFFQHFPKLCNMIFGTLYFLNDKKPLRFFTTFFVIGDVNCHSIGLKGNIHGNHHDYVSLGFTGLTLRPSSDKVYLFGFTPYITSDV